MRILITTPYRISPETSGGVRRTLGIARALASSGHSVSLLSCDSSVPPDPAYPTLCSLTYRSGGRIGHFVNRHFSRALDCALAKGQDLVIASFPYQARDLVRHCGRRNIPLVYDAHNVESVRFAATGNPIVARLVGLAERHLSLHADAILAVSADDQREFRRRYGRPSLLLPNGVDVDTFSPGKPDQKLLRELGLHGKRIAIYCGSFDYRPNVHALQHLLRQAWPLHTPELPDTHLLVVGRQPPQFAVGRSGVVVAGEVPDLVPYLRLANLALAPLSSGGGTRLKIIEALACGQQVLSTRFGAAGLSTESVPGLHLCELEEFDRCLAQLLAGDVEPGANLAGREWAQALDWQHTVKSIDWSHLAGETATV